MFTFDVTKCGQEPNVGALAVIVGSCTLLVMSGKSTVRVSLTPGSTSALLIHAIVDDCTLACAASPSHQARDSTTAVVA